MGYNDNSEWNTLMEYEYNKILLEGNGGHKSIIIKKKYAHQIQFERTSINFNIKRLWLVLHEIIFVELVCLHDELS